MPDLPRWDMTTFFPSADSPQCAAELQAVIAAIADLTALFDAHGIGRRPFQPIDHEQVALFEMVLSRYDVLLRRGYALCLYLGCSVAADTEDAAALGGLSTLAQHGISPDPSVRIAGLHQRFVAWIGALDVHALAARSPLARDHEYRLRQATLEAAHLMTPDAEDVSAALDACGVTAWAQLRNRCSSQISVLLEREGVRERLPISAVTQRMLGARDRSVRRQAFDAVQRAWEQHALPIAAALNGIKGGNAVQSRKRGWPSVLDQALFEQGIDRQIFDAMQEAVRESFPAIRRYWRAKARLLDLPVLASYDLRAPIDEGGEAWTYDRAYTFVTEQFAAYSPRLAALAERAACEHWIDAAPRVGKEAGAFASPITPSQTRILLNYTPSFIGLATLAHELGHAYHFAMLAPHTMLHWSLPMTMAETASIFCETLVTQAALRSADTAHRLAALNDVLASATLYTMDVTCAFEFEHRFFEGRARREVSVPEINALMLEAQRSTYDDGIDPTTYGQFAWAATPHYYLPSTPYYNFPYTFGWLFALGLYDAYQHDPEAFRVGYDDLLSSTGMAAPAALAARVGINLDAAFWRRGLDVVRGNVEEFERLVEQRAIDTMS